MELALLAILFSGALVVFFSYREEKTKKILSQKQHIYNQQLYQISLLTQIQDRIGYELHKEKITDVILDNLTKFFTFTAASTLLIKEGKLRFKSHLAETVGRPFIMEVRRSMIASLSSLTKTDLPLAIDEEIVGLPIEDTGTQIVQSSFHIPFTVNGETVGLINLSSRLPNHFRKDDIALLERLTYQAAHALGRLQELLSTEEGRLMALIKSLTDGVFMLDTNSQILIINDAAKNLLSLSKDRLSLLDVLRALPKEYDLIEKIHEAISEKKTIEDRSIKLAQKTVQIFITPVIDTRTLNVLGLSILLHDSTLEENIARMKRDFINMVIHELRAPTTAIKDSAKLILQSMDTLPKETQKRLLDIIHTQAGILLEQVSSLLDAAKMEEHRLVLDKSTVNLQKLVKNRMEIFAPQAAKKHISLTAQFDAHVPPLLLDEMRIGQVINNLISNSLKFTPNGGSITVKTRKQDEAVHIEVADTGIGIPKEKQSQLFHRFSQIDSSLYDGKETPEAMSANFQGHSGTGLGLYIAKGIIEAHGGTISIDSDVDRGTRITITLPLHVNEQAEEQHTPVPVSQIFKTSVN